MNKNAVVGPDQLHRHLKLAPRYGRGGKPRRCKKPL